MAELTPFNDNLNSDDFEKKVMPSGLNVLTILTYIGCALISLFLLLTPWITNFMLKLMNDGPGSGQHISPEKLAEMEKSRPFFELMHANMLVYIIMGAIGILLCFTGALMMRKFKKDGFWIYTAGQILPIIGGFAIFGKTQFTGGSNYIIPGIEILFIILYSTQRKYLVR